MKMYKKYLLSIFVLFMAYAVIAPNTASAFWPFDYFKQDNVQKGEDLTGAVNNAIDSSSSSNEGGGGGGGSSTPTITVTAPNGGEKWQIGSTHSILWAPYSYDPDVNPSKDVSAFLEVGKENGDTFDTLGKIEEDGMASIHWSGYLNNNGIYSKASPGNNYYVRVVNNVTGEWDRSDHPFTLTPEGSVFSDLKINGSNGPIVSPPEEGSIYNVVWNSNTDKCSVYNGTLPYTDSGAYLNNLLPSGKLSLLLMPNNTLYDSYVTLFCQATLSTEGSSFDYVRVLPSGTPKPKFSAKITYPNGGEFIDRSRASSISWNITGDTYEKGGIEAISLALYKNNKFFSWIAKDMPVYGGGIGGILWTPSDIIPTKDKIGKKAIYKIYMIGRKTGTTFVKAVTDSSDKPFSIVNMQ